MNSAIYVHLPQAVWAFVPAGNGYASSKLKWLKILTQCFLSMKFARWMMGSYFWRQLGLLVLIHTTSCACLVRDKLVGPKPDHSLTTCYGHARWPSTMQMHAPRELLPQSGWFVQPPSVWACVKTWLQRLVAQLYVIVSPIICFKGIVLLWTCD